MSEYALKPTYNGTTKDHLFFVPGRFRLIQVFKVWTFRSPHPRDRKMFPLKTWDRYARVPYKTGFAVYVYLDGHKIVSLHGNSFQKIHLTFDLSIQFNFLLYNLLPIHSNNIIPCMSRPKQ